MKKLFIIMAIATMAFVSCSKEQLNTKDVQTEGEVSSYTLTAIAPGDDQTKTSLQKGEGTNWNVLWSENDALKVKISGDGTSSSHYANYTLESGAGKGNAIFRGSVEAPDEVFAFYPSSLVGTINSHGMFFNIPTYQTYSATGEVENNSLPMWANGNKTNLTFNHICSIIRVPVWTEETGVKLKQVTISSTATISGGWYFNKSDFSVPKVASGASSNVTLLCNDMPVSISSTDPTVLNFVLGVPSGSCGTLTFEFIFSDNTNFVKSTSSLAMGAKKGKIYKLPELKLVKSGADLQIKIDNGSWESWDGASNIATPTSSVAVKGTNSRLARSSMALILTKIKSGDNVIDLDFGGVEVASDLKNLTQSGDMFYENNKVGSVILPEGIERITSMAFRNSTIKTLTLPNSVSTVDGYVFFQSSNGRFAVKSGNTKFFVREGVLYSKSGTPPTETIILEQVPYGISGSYEVDSDVTEIGKLAFGYCQTITELKIPSSVSTIRSKSTEGMMRLSHIILLGETPATLDIYNKNSHWDTNLPGSAVSGAKTITVPAGCLEAYTGTEGNRTDWWKQYHDIAGYEFTE